MDLKRPPYQRTVRWTMQGLMETFLNIICCCNFTTAKSREASTVLLDNGLFLKNRTTLAKKHSAWPSSTLKTIDLDYRSSLLVAQLVRFWFKSLQSLTVNERQFLQGNLFLLAVCMHEVPLYLCSIFCSPSVVQLRTVSYRIWSTEHALKMYPVTLRHLYTHSCCLIKL